MKYFLPCCKCEKLFILKLYVWRMYKFCLLAVVLWCVEANAQDSIAVAKVDTTMLVKKTDTTLIKGTTLRYDGNSFFPYSKQKERIVTYSQMAAYTTNFASLYSFWYKDYPLVKFHFFNDDGEYLQVDKVSHMFGSYIGGKTSMQMWKWAGVSKKKYVWLGGMTGLAYETVIEVMDGFSQNWGFSTGDYTANLLGTSILIGQELAWDEQRIQIKYSTHYETYSDPGLESFAVNVDGRDKLDRLFKNYNPQTYWLSANIKSFFKNANVPNWLNIAVGYGAENIVGAYNNNVIDVNGNIINADNIYPRYRQWYLAPDIDLTKIKTKSKILKTVFFVLNTFKFPAPSLELSQGKIKWNWIHF